MPSVGTLFGRAMVHLSAIGQRELLALLGRHRSAHFLAQRLPFLLGRCP
jgi:hypothetical protein